MTLRERTGINLEKVRRALPLLDLPVVRQQAARELRQHEVEAIAYELLHCLLKAGSNVLPEKVRTTIWIELNFDRNDSLFKDRKNDVREAIDFWGDYDAHTRACYDELAVQLLPLDVWPCSNRLVDKNRRIAQLETLHEDFATRVLREALFEMAVVKGRIETLELAKRILEGQLPHALRTARALGADFLPAHFDEFEILHRIIQKIAFREWRVWKAASKGMFVDAQSPVNDPSALLQVIFQKHAPEPTTATRRRAGYLTTSFQLLAIIMRSFEDRDAWIEVLLDENVGESDFADDPNQPVRPN